MLLRKPVAECERGLDSLKGFRPPWRYHDCGSDYLIALITCDRYALHTSLHLLAGLATRKRPGLQRLLRKLLGRHTDAFGHLHEPPDALAKLVEKDRCLAHRTITALSGPSLRQIAHDLKSLLIC